EPVRQVLLPVEERRHLELARRGHGRARPAAHLEPVGRKALLTGSPAPSQRRGASLRTCALFVGMRRSLARKRKRPAEAGLSSHSVNRPNQSALSRSRISLPGLK